LQERLIVKQRTIDTGNNNFRAKVSFGLIMLVD
jgi:hypothetical protein